METQTDETRELFRMRLRQFWHRPRIKEAKSELVITRQDYQWTDAEADQWLVDLLGQDTVESLRGQAVLDFGCGVGRLTAAALRAGARRVYAVDVSETMLRHARSELGLAAQQRVEFVVSNGDDCGMMPDDMANIAFSALCFQHMVTFRQARDCFDALVRATRPGGKIIIQGHYHGREQDATEPGFYGVRLYPDTIQNEHVMLVKMGEFPSQPQRRWWIAEYRKCT